MPKPSISDILARSFTDHTVDLLRVAESTNKKMRAFLNKLQKEIISRMANADLTGAQSAHLQVLLGDVNSQIARTYSSMRALSAMQIEELIRTEALVVAKVMNSGIGIDLMSGLLPGDAIRSLLSNTLISGATNEAWWVKQATHLSFRFEQAMRSGIASGETLDALVRRVRGSKDEPGLMDATRRDAEAMVRTATMTAANKGRLAMFRANSDVLDGVQQLSTLDMRTTEVCMVYDHACWDLDGEPIRGTKVPFVNEGGSEDGIPRHWGCRSTLLGILKGEKELKLKGSTRASMDGQVAATLSFADWFKSRSIAQQDKILGKGKAALWRQGKISFRDLLDQRGSPLTLEELRDKHGV